MRTGVTRAAGRRTVPVLGLAVLLAAAVGLGAAAASTRATPHPLVPTVPKIHGPSVIPMPVRSPGSFAVGGCQGRPFRDSLSAPPATVWTCFVAPERR